MPRQAATRDRRPGRARARAVLRSSGRPRRQRQRRPRRFTMRRVSRSRRSRSHRPDSSTPPARSRPAAWCHTDRPRPAGSRPARGYRRDIRKYPSAEIQDRARRRSSHRRRCRHPCASAKASPSGSWSRRRSGSRAIEATEISSTMKCGAISARPCDAMILMGAGIDRRDRGAVGMAEQQAAAKADRVEQFRQHVERLDMHVVERARQLHRRRMRRSRRANRRTRRRRSRPEAFRESRPTARPSRALHAASRWSARSRATGRSCGIRDGRRRR